MIPSFLAKPSRPIKTIEHLEKTYPGYWYSISMQPAGVTVSLGPSLYCPDSLSRRWTATAVGDSGCVLSYDTNCWTQDPNIPSRADLDHFLKSIDKSVSEAQLRTFDYPDVIPEKKGLPRQQTKLDLWKLWMAYYRFRNEHYQRMLERGINVTEVYIGSCHLSCDVSLRGTYGVSGKSFDVSVDLLDGATLVDSFKEAVVETYALIPK